MQVLLINPRSEFLAEPAFVPPLGLLYLGTALEDAGFEPKVADLNLPEVTIEGYDPGLIGITCVTANFGSVKQIVADFRTFYPGVPIVVGGPHLSVRPRDWKKLGADWACTCDGEEIIKRPAGCSGNVPPGTPVDVNYYPFPARHLVPIHDYKCTLDGEPAAPIVSQRGCPFGCSFCCRWEGSRKVRARFYENVYEEVMQLKRLGFRSFVFHDDEFNLLNARLLDLCGWLRGARIHFRANIRADLFTGEQADALADAGCSWLCVGVESGNAAILKAARKGTTPEDNARARVICKSSGIKFKAFVMVGLPGETHETVADTKRWLIENEVDDLTVTMFVPYPGTDVYEHPERYDIRFDADYEKTSLMFRGGAGHSLPRCISTSGLSAEELAEMPEILESEVRRELGIEKRTYRGNVEAVA
jgi:radical SAM superfamily enzyme YgiQ (UPF0313 family)